MIELTPAAPVRSTRFAGLDGLRAIAVITVVVFHFVPAALPGGYVGVDVFFVISGFLITALLLSEHESAGGVRLGGFWVRRARRLLPALIVMVLTCTTVAVAVGGDVLAGIRTQLLGAATFSSNWLLIATGDDYFSEAAPELFRNLWSLAVEEQFYLVWPLVILALVALRRRWVRVAIVATVGAVSAVLMFLLADAAAGRAYYGTDTHAFGLAIGAVLALALQGRLRAPGTGTGLSMAERIRIDRDPTERFLTGWWMPVLGAIGGLGILALSWILDADTGFAERGGLVLVSLATALTILGAITTRSWWGRALDNAPMRWVGVRSYGLYLWHWPVLLLVTAMLPGDAPWWTAPTVALVVTVLAAAASFRWVETPIRTLGFRGAFSRFFEEAPSRAVVRTLGVGLLAGTAVVSTVSAAVVEPSVGQVQALVEQGQQAIEDAAAARPAPPAASGTPAPVPTREPAALPGGEQIYAVGDSVMLAAAPQLTEAFPGIAIDASVSRHMSQAEPIVQALVGSGAQRPILVLALGTNGPIDEESLAGVQQLLGSDCLIVLVNAQAPAWWIPEVNQALADFARGERNVEVADWYSAITPQIDVLADDEVHPGPTGSAIYVSAIRDALQRLADLPPLRVGPEYAHVDTPV